MKSPKSNLRIITALGYILLVALIAAAYFFVDDELDALSQSNNIEESINRRQRATNAVVTNLYQAEVVGQSVSAGQTDCLPLYRRMIAQTRLSIDSLRTFTADKKQVERIDSVMLLLDLKEATMDDLVDAIRVDKSDSILERLLHNLSRQQSILQPVKMVSASDTVTTNQYVIHQKRKNFFGRLKDVFSSAKTDSLTVSGMSHSQALDTLYSQQAVAMTNNNEAIANIKRHISNARLEQIAQLRQRTDSLRATGQELSNKLAELLEDIVNDSERMLRLKQRQAQTIRQDAAEEIALAAFVALILAVVFLIIIWRDITRSVHYRRQLEVAKKRAEDLLSAREQLMLTITHDIKAPAGSIIGFAELLQTSENEAQRRTYINNMQRSAQHLLELVNSLLDFHRLEAQKMDVNVAPFNPKALVEDVAECFMPEITKKGLKAFVYINPALDCSIEGDAFRIRQMVDNLMSNAVKFTKQGSISLSAEVSDGLWHIAVTDTGCGIDDSERSRIFKEFSRLSNAQGEEGFGLGLAITLRLVKLLDGDINVVSSKGKGSTFTITLPMKPTSSADNPKAGETRLASPLAVAVIDDDRLQMQLTQSMLRKAGADAIVCSDIDALRKAVSGRHIDVVLSDIQMPAISGFDLVKTISGIPVVAVSARSDIDDLTVRKQGFAGCLHKPFSISELVEALRRATSRHPYNFDALTAFVEDDNDAACEILSAFIADTITNISRLEKALANNDILEASEVAHKMLPTFTMIGADRALPSLMMLNNRRDATLWTDADATAVALVIAEAKAIIAAR